MPSTPLHTMLGTRHLLRSAPARLGSRHLRVLESSISRGFATSTPRHQSPENNTNSFREGMSAFRPFARPFIKVFLGALFTYQVIYWAWFKLETGEKKFLKNEIGVLEKEARELAQKK